MQNLIWADFKDLDRDQLYDLLQLRNEVFVVEQQSLFPDIDGLDRHARHLLLLIDRNLAGYLRLRGPDHGDEITLSRVVLRKSARGQGLGRVLMEAAIAESGRLYSQSPIKLSAQIEQEAFYGSLGFVRVPGEPYDDAGILHVDMIFGKTAR
ncbi:GNAT family N-acetyltransferase [Pelagibius sp. Alg239-R121]|uniref:GNAT family N-acetyltransferase n=1 Tax=Pelagibius sp. Alg239-R121 TaxID=2993448 RepID=UPI0024A6D70A|nr:GNAT family N-acetyltransferase [Pelagibius sp. Alg239-R121]